MSRCIVRLQVGLRGPLFVKIVRKGSFRRVIRVRVGTKILSFPPGLRCDRNSISGRLEGTFRSLRTLCRLALGIVGRGLILRGTI